MKQDKLNNKRLYSEGLLKSTNRFKFKGYLEREEIDGKLAQV